MNKLTETFGDSVTAILINISLIAVFAHILMKIIS